MAIPIFLSHPKPCTTTQAAFVGELRTYLAARGLEAKTLGVNEYDKNAPLAGIRRLMLECNGVIVLAFARYEIKAGRHHFTGPDGNGKSESIANTWMTSPWCQIESGMGFQLGLPMLIFRERNVMADGVLQHGVMGAYMPAFDLDRDSTEYLGSEECRQLLQQFESQVVHYRDAKGIPRVW